MKLRQVLWLLKAGILLTSVFYILASCTFVAALVVSLATGLVWGLGDWHKGAQFREELKATPLASAGFGVGVISVVLAILFVFSAFQCLLYITHVAFKVVATGALLSFAALLLASGVPCFNAKT